MTVNWKAITEQVTGYEIQYATASSFSGAKTVTIINNKTATKVYSNWSAVKNVKVK